MLQWHLVWDRLLVGGSTVSVAISLNKSPFLYECALLIYVLTAPSRSCNLRHWIKFELVVPWWGAGFRLHNCGEFSYSTGARSNLWHEFGSHPPRNKGPWQNTTSEGANMDWKEQNPSDRPLGTSIPRNKVWVVGRTGIERWTDGKGRRWQPEEEPTRKQPKALCTEPLS